MKTNLFKIILRLPSKVSQYLLFNKLKLNNDFRLFKIKFGEKYLENSFRIIKSAKEIPFKENFILSGLNLAFLGYYFKGEIPYFKKIIHWRMEFLQKRYLKELQKYLVD